MQPLSLATDAPPKVEWANISSEDDLRKLKDVLGSFQAIKQKLSDDLGLKVSAGGYSELLKHIQQFQLVFGKAQQQDNQGNNNIKSNATQTNKPTHEDAHFFASEQHRLTYALIRLEGSQRMDMLAVTCQHWEDVELIKKWFRNLSKEVHPDHNKVAGADLAWQKLEKIKNDLMKHAERFGTRSK